MIICTRKRELLNHQDTFNLQNVNNEFMNRLHFKSLILAMLYNMMVMAQTATDPLTTNAIVYNTDESKMFFGQESLG